MSIFPFVCLRKEKIVFYVVRFFLVYLLFDRSDVKFFYKRRKRKIFFKATI